MTARNFTISAFTQNSPGVLHRITILFTRRKVNVESLTVCETEKPDISRFTIVVRVEPDLIEKIVRQINRVIEVVDVFYSEDEDLIAGEIAFIKVGVEDQKARQEIEDLAHRYHAPIRYASADAMVLEVTGSEEHIQSLFVLFERYGVLEFVRSGRIAVLRAERRPAVRTVNLVEEVLDSI